MPYNRRSAPARPKRALKFPPILARLLASGSMRDSDIHSSPCADRAPRPQPTSAVRHVGPRDATNLHTPIMQHRGLARQVRSDDHIMAPGRPQWPSTRVSVHLEIPLLLSANGVTKHQPRERSSVPLPPTPVQLADERAGAMCCQDEEEVAYVRPLPSLKERPTTPAKISTGFEAEEWSQNV